MTDFPHITRKQGLKQDLKYFYTGTKCPRGHIAPRYVSDYTCVECKSPQVVDFLRDMLEHGIEELSILNIDNSDNWTKYNLAPIDEKREAAEVLIDGLGNKSPYDNPFRHLLYVNKHKRNYVCYTGVLPDGYFEWLNETDFTKSKTTYCCRQGDAFVQVDKTRQEETGCDLTEDFD